MPQATVSHIGQDNALELQTQLRARQEASVSASMPSFQQSLTLAQASLTQNGSAGNSGITARQSTSTSQSGPRPIAIVRNTSSTRTSTGPLLTNSMSGLYEPLQARTSTAFDKIRQRNETIKQRLVASPVSSSSLLPSSTTVGRRTTSPVAPVKSPGSIENKPDTNGAMAIADYPRPVDDNGRGMHWIPTLKSDKATVDRFVQEMVDMKMKWAVVLNDNTNIGDNDYLVNQLVANGIEPVMRIYTHEGRPIEGDVGALVQHYKPMGIDYYQLYNEPNLTAENEWQEPDPKRYVDMWLPAAKAVTEAGGLPGFGALAPGGNFDDVEFFKQALDCVKSRGETKALDKAWISLHNYTLNHPLDYTKDSNGFLKFRNYDEIVREKIGRSLPIIGTEGGTHVGVDSDATMPSITEERQVEMVKGAYEYMQNAEPYFFTNTYWIIANRAGGGTDDGFEWQALFQTNKTSPVVDVLRKLSASPRKLPAGAKASAAAGATAPASVSNNAVGGQRIVNEAMKYLGKAYVWGGESPDPGFDCTGFTWYVMGKLGKNIPLHDLEGQLGSGTSVRRQDLQPGDFVFFKDTYKQGLSHVGIYAGNNTFVHAASEKYGVIVSSLDESYWASRYIGASRIKT